MTFTEIGDCFLALGRLEEAAKAYEEMIRRAPSLSNLRGTAVAKGQLGTVRLLQKRYKEALESYTEVRGFFEALGEPRMVATAWHQIGLVHKEAGQFNLAEEAYRHSLVISVCENNLAGQGDTLNQLGGLYDSMGRLEEASTFLRQAAEVSVRLEDLAKEGTRRSNLANTLIKLRRFDEARQELWRAIECGRPYSHASQHWKTWSILEDLERTTGHAEAAQAAGQQAIETYLAYRRAGGVSQSNQAELVSLVHQAIQQNAEPEAAQRLNQLLEPDDPPQFTALIRQLQAALAGDRDPALAAEPELDYMDAAELQLLLESLQAGT